MNIDVGRISRSVGKMSRQMDYRMLTASTGARRAALGIGAAGSAYSAYQSVNNARQGNYGRAAAWGAASGALGRRSMSNLSIHRALGRM